MLRFYKHLGRHLGVLLVLLCGAGRAQATFKNGPTKVLGFTKDGAAFVFIETEAGQNEGDYRIRVIDTRTWEPHDYSVPPSGYVEPDKDTVARRNSEQVRFDAWHKQHPTRCSGGRTSPDGQVEVKFAITGKRLFVEQLPQGIAVVSAYAGAEGLADAGATIEVLSQESVKESDKEDPPPRWLLRWKGQSSARFSARLTPCWSPDGRRLGLVVESSSGFFREPGTRDLYLLPVHGPLVELRARRPRSAAVRAVALGLDQAGIVVSQLSVSKKPPQVTQVRSKLALEELRPKFIAIMGQIEEDGTQTDGLLNDIVIELADSVAVPPAPPHAGSTPPTGAPGGAGEEAR